jgi:hypothetical protein
MEFMHIKPTGNWIFHVSKVTPVHVQMQMNNADEMPIGIKPFLNIQFAFTERKALGWK